MDISKLGLKEHQLEKIKNIEFKKEHLGALEFNLTVTDAEFNEKEEHFRIERVPTETALRIGDIEKLAQLVPKSLESFVALPVEAKKLNYFDFDNEALTVLSTVISKFQMTPSIFK